MLIPVNNDRKIKTKLLRMLVEENVPKIYFPYKPKNSPEINPYCDANIFRNAMLGRLRMTRKITKAIKKTKT